MIFHPKKLISKLLGSSEDLRSEFSPLDQHVLNAYNATRTTDASHTLCHAPLKSIRFTQFGKATVCWKNERHILGEYPRDTIHDTWFGENAEKLRHYIRQNDLSLGCEICKGHLTRGEYFDLRARDFDSKPLAKNGYPSFGEFVLGSACNLECIMCSGKYSSSIRKNREMKPLYHDPYDDQFVEQLEEFIPHFTYTCYFGGEPFYYGLHYKIWDKIIQLNPACDITVQTNGTLLNDRIKKLLERGKFNIYLSIDSMDAANYEKIRVNASFDKIMENVRYFIEYCRSNNRMIRISACPMRQNWADMPEIVSYCNTHNIEVKFNPTWFPPDCSLWNWNSDTLKQIYDQYDMVEFPDQSERSEENIRRFTELKNQILEWSNQSKNTDQNRSVIDLKNELLTKIDNHFQNDAPYIGNSEISTSQEFIQMIDRILTSFKVEQQLYDLLVKINQYPVSYLVSEVDANLEDVTLERFKLLTRKLPVTLSGN